MHWRRLAVAGMVAGCIAGCGGDAAGPGSGGSDPGVSVRLTDPTGDPFGNRGTLWDLTAMTVTRDTDAVTVILEFSSPLISPTSGDSNAMIAFVDFDTDQDSATGNPTMADAFRRDSSSTGMGSEFRLDVAEYAADSSVRVFDESATVTGQVKPVFSGNRVTIRIPRALLGNDDGFLNAAAIVGTTGSPDDVIPQTGHLRLVPTNSAEPPRSTLPAF